MASDKRSTVFANLKTLLATVTGIKTVEVLPRSVAEIPEDQYPAVFLVEGEDETEHNVGGGSEFYLHLDIGIMWVYQTTNASDPYSKTEIQAQDIEDEIIKAIEGAAVNHLSNSCENIYCLKSKKPFVWPDVGQNKFRGRVARVVMRMTRT